MCAIAGILHKNGKRLNCSTGEALTRMLEATLHRGPDSVGWALYHDPKDERLRLCFYIPRSKIAKDVIADIKKAISDLGAEIVEDNFIGCIYMAKLKCSIPAQKLYQSLKSVVELFSIGTRLDVIKDVGQPKDLAPLYGINDFDGTHGLAHLRLATESGVHPNTTHPFWAPGFADICTVHNGMITNYWIMRRRLERRGMEFLSNNDTELIAVYLAYKMSQGVSLEDALISSLDDFDGTYSYLVSTSDSIGFAKDKLAAKPVVIYEDDNLIAISSEDVGLNSLFPGQTLETTEQAPLTHGIWSRA